MTKGRFRSVRARLILWSMAIIALVLGGFGAACLIFVPKVLMASVDRDLESKAKAVPLGLPNGFPSSNIVARSGPFRMPAGAVLNSRREVSTIFVSGSTGMPGSGTSTGSLGKLVQSQTGVREKLARGENAFAEVSLEGKRYRVLAIPTKIGEIRRSFMLMTYPVDELYSLIDTLRGLFLLLLPLALGATFVAGRFLAAKVLQPVRQINRAASEVEAHDLSKRLPVTGQDEFAELTTTINGMFDRLQLSFGQLAHSVEQQKRFVADASHELRTPLTVIRGSASWGLGEGRSDAEMRAALGDADVAAKRMERLISNLLWLAKSDANRLIVEPSTIGLQSLFEAVTSRFTGAPKIKIEVQPRELSIRADEDKLRQILGNLIENAVRHTPTSGSVRLSAKDCDGWLEILVTDTGSGISERHLPHVFDRFYRADESRSAEEGGTGLGLAIARELVRAHAGTITLTSQIGVGTEVVVRLPA